MRILVTGVAGFIGMAVARELLARGHDVTGIDNLNNHDYYLFHPFPQRSAMLELTYSY